MSKESGLLAEIRFQLAASMRGLTVSKPQGDFSPYDFIVDTGTRLLKIQVKSSSFRDNLGRYQFNLKVGNLKNRSYTAKEVHYFALYCTHEGVFFIIPQTLIKDRKTLKLSLNGPFKHFREDFDFAPGKIRHERN